MTRRPRLPLCGSRCGRERREARARQAHSRSRAGAGAICFTLLLAGCGARPVPVIVGSKKFTESVILGEIAAQLLQQAGFRSRHQAQLGGTRVLWSALLAGEIDAYPEYTGTLCQEILHTSCDEARIRAALAQQHVAATGTLGFSDGYAIAVRADLADALHLTRISDLATHPELRLGFSEELLARNDGWPGLRQRYGLAHAQVRGLDHDLAWRALAAGTLDAIDAYTTDAEIRYYHPRLLDDDRAYFTQYAAMLLYRDAGALRPVPAGARAVLDGLAGRIGREQMVDLNARAKLDKVPEAQVAADWVAGTSSLRPRMRASAVGARIAHRTGEHLLLVAISLAGAIAVGLPLGIAASRYRRIGVIILGATGLLQTIPSLALLVFMIPIFGIGAPPALCALLAYSLLPIVRNTAAGLDGIAPPLRESAAVLGLSRWERLRVVELPLAAPSILAGIKTAAVIDVGTATLGALIGAGGYGQPILTGIRLDDTGLILEGAIPAAVLALIVQALFAALERRTVSRGLRVDRSPD